MNEMQAMIIGLVAKLGIEGALIVLNNIAKAITIDDAIAALQVAQKTTWEDFKKNA